MSAPLTKERIDHALLDARTAQTHTRHIGGEYYHVELPPETRDVLCDAIDALRAENARLLDENVAANELLHEYADDSGEDTDVEQTP